MGRKHSMMIWAGIAVIALMGLFPPWMVTWGPAGGVTAPGGHAFIFSSADSIQASVLGQMGIKLAGASQQMAASYGIKLDFMRLLVQWIVVAVVMGGVCCAACRCQKKE
ncbi:MAG: hypothetical protein HZB29_05225 [Nitrospinae bacterium]|nr:hypothetical protein [Nitrospinota bacterium]